MNLIGFYRRFLSDILKNPAVFPRVDHLDLCELAKFVSLNFSAESDVKKRFIQDESKWLTHPYQGCVFNKGLKYIKYPMFCNWNQVTLGIGKIIGQYSTSWWSMFHHHTWIFQICKICAFSPEKPTKRQKFYISGRSRYIYGSKLLKERSTICKMKYHQFCGPQQCLVQLAKNGGWRKSCDLFFNPISSHCQMFLRCLSCPLGKRNK